MARISLEQVKTELASKKLKLSEKTLYENLNSQIEVECEKGHKFITTLKSVRYANFVCPVCVGEKTKGFTESPTDIPKKRGYRIIGVDNATYKMGASLFENGKLIYFKLFEFKSNNHIQRLNEIRDLFEQEIIPIWDPDFIQFEDIQLQKSHAAYEILIKLVGVIEMSAYKFNTDYEKTRANVWRSHFGINLKDRSKEKQRAIQMVYDMYGIQVSDDVAEAILIGKYRANIKSSSEIEVLF